MTKSSKIIIALLIILIIVVFAFGGYFIWKLNDEVEKENNEVNVSKNNNENIGSLNYVDDEYNSVENNDLDIEGDYGPVSVLYDVEKTYTNESGITEIYTYRLPKINIESEYANEINNEIKELVTKVENFVSKLDNGYDILYEEYCYGFDYNYAINGDIVSIIIFVNNESDADDAIVYNINTKGEKVEKAMLLEKSNIKESEFQDKIFSLIKSNDIFYSAVDHTYLAKEDDCALDKCDLLYLYNGELYVAVKISGTDVAGKAVINVRTGWPLNG
ncbi:MAG: hypothetical protein J6A89_04585 [Clostridia bacterium]|nr:hypothetical protein [Clostridia bacterium]